MRRFKRIGCGCLVIIFILIVLWIIGGAYVVKKLINGAITQQTGIVQTNTETNGQSYTDPKTGATLNLGNNKLPDNFPTDFPIYPKATITSSWSANGFGLSLTTPDTVDKIITFYENNLPANGWTLKETTASGTVKNWVISKSNFSGFVTITNTNNQNAILVVLSEATPEP